jgi:two-component system invasion response regulator UvrY
MNACSFAIAGGRDERRAAARAFGLGAGPTANTAQAKEIMTIGASVIRLVLIDDHPVVRDGYRRLLESTGDMVVLAEGRDGAEAVALYREHHPDVIVLDIAMPGGGLDALRQIHDQDPDAKCLIFSVHDSESMLTQAMQFGAMGYLSKRADPDEMLAAVYAVAKGKAYVNSELLSRALGQRGATQIDPLDVLTRRELEVFKLLAEGRQVGEIAGELGISPRTVGVHHTRIMHKLDAQNRAQLVRLALQFGVVEF